MRTTQPETVLFVDDDPNVLKAVQRTLRNSPYRVILTNSAQGALQACSTQPIDVIVSDQRMPGMTGIELLTRVGQRRPQTIRILFTAYAEEEVLIRAINESEVFRFIPKPFHPAELLAVLKAAFDRKHRGTAVVVEARASAGQPADGSAASEGAPPTPQLRTIPRTPVVGGATSPQTLATADADFLAAWAHVVSTEPTGLGRCDVALETKHRS